eukprot:m.461798 g.461798  ORF g.461798 m.461798 type:complete len:67 (+) comp233151_c0_seq1:2-202(+)
MYASRAVYRGDGGEEWRREQGVWVCHGVIGVSTVSPPLRAHAGGYVAGIQDTWHIQDTATRVQQQP